MGSPPREEKSHSASSSLSDDSSSDRTDYQRPRVALERRSTIPTELEDPEDCTVGEADSEYFPLARCDDADESKRHLITLKDELQKLPKELRNILAGGIAGMTAKSVVAPLERIKILYQVSSARFHLKDVPNVFRNIIRDEGGSALWKGNTATMIRVFPYSGIQFMVFDRVKHYFLHEHEKSALNTHGASNDTRSPQPTPEDRHSRKWGLTPMESLVGGMIAGTVSVICTYPLDLTRAQLAVLKKKANHNQGFVSILVGNYRRAGVAGLFRGLSPTLLGILPYSGFAFALNEQGKREIHYLTGRDVTNWERMQCGAFSGLVAQTVTYPIEVTRRRMQTIGLVGNRNDTALTSLGCSSQRPVVTSPPTMISTIRELFAEQGTRGFLKGVSMNWMKGPVAFSISFTTFDNVQKWMESPKERSQRLPIPYRSVTETIRRDG